MLTAATEQFTLHPTRGAQLLPFVRGLAKASTNLDIIEAQNRLQSGYDYSKPIRPATLSTVPGLGGKAVPIPLAYSTREKDEALVARAKEYAERQYTTAGAAVPSIALLPALGIEFAATGGLASGGKNLTEKGVTLALGRYAASPAGQATIKTAGWAGGAVARGTLGLPTRTAATATERQVEVQVLGKGEEGWATSLTKAWGDTIITAAAESAGEGLTRLPARIASKTKFGGRFITALQSAWMKATGGSKGAFVRELTKKGGFSNIIDELSEERLETLMRSVTGVDERDADMSPEAIYDRVVEGIKEDARNLGTEAIVLAVPGATQVVGGLGAAARASQRVKDIDTLRRLELSAPKVNEPIEATSPAPTTTPDSPAAVEQTVQVGQPPVPVGADPESSVTKAVNEPPLVPVEGTTPDTEAAPIQRSFRNSTLEETRQSAGLPPVVEADPAGTIQQQYDTAIEEGYGEVDTAVTNARKILEEGRMATDKETYGMSAATETLRQRINASAQAILDTPVGSEAYRRAEEAVDRDTQALDVLTRVGQATGTMWARIGHARQVVLNDNGDYVSLLARVKRATGKEITPEVRDRYLKKASEIQRRRAMAADGRRAEVQGRARKHMRKLSKLGKLAKMTEAEKDQQLQDLLSRELTEVTLTDIALNLASRESDPTIDRVVQRVREYLPNVSHEQIVDAFDQASRRQTRHTHGMEAVLKSLKRQFRKEKNKLTAIDDVLYWLKEGKLPDGTEASLEVDDQVVRDLEVTLQQVKELQRNSEPWLQRKLQKQIDYLTARLAAKDFTNKRQVQATAPSRATLELMYRAKMLDRQVGREVARLKSKQLHWVLRGIAEVTRDIQSIKSSYDDSGLLNQGGMIAWAHPIRAARTLPKALGAALSDKRAFEIEEEIQNRANAPLYSLYDIGLTEASDASQFGQREENFRGILAERIPGVKASNRMFATTLNILRADSFDALVGADAYALGTSHADLQAAADFVSMASGRGNVRGFESTVNAMNGIFWAPRRTISRFQMLATLGGQIEYQFRSKDGKKAGIHLRGSRQFRMAIAGEMARYLMGVSAAMLLAKYGLGADVELDPRSSDFLKLRFGNMRLDPLSGMSQTLVLLTRLNPFIMQKKTIDGKIEDLSAYDVDQTLQRFFHYKFTPALGISYSMLRGRTPFDGSWEWNLEGALWVAKESVVPITFEDVVQSAIDQGIPRAAIANTWGWLGMGVQIYGDNYTPHSDGPRRTYGVRSY